jgi:serine protease Do
MRRERMGKYKEFILNRRYSYVRIAKHGPLSIFLILGFLIFPLFGERHAAAEYYKYQDKSGNWVFTDSPPADSRNVEIIGNKGGKSSGFRDIEKDLTGKYRPKDEIEKACLSTVTIKSPMGQGSGFFISGEGHIMTNKHVLRGDETHIKRTEELIERQDQKIEDDEARLVEHEQRLRRMKTNLDEYKEAIDRMTDPNRKIMAMQSYRRQSGEYDFYKAQLKKRKSDFEDKKRKYQQEKTEFTGKTRTAEHARHFTVILKDQTELEAYLVAVSKDHDLALLKIDGCRSPYLQARAPHQLMQGMRVFAIGSPLGLSDSVSSGVLSGYDPDYIRTDARIYPGNSGGPLIASDGKVIGINTMKLITHKFEGIGFAIPLSIAFEEFDHYLKTIQ